MREKLEVRETYVNQMSGLRTLELSERAREVVFGWLTEKGIDPYDVIRCSRWNSKGRLTFKVGVGYAVFDADLLGGDGTGDTEREFEDDTNAYLWIK